MPLPDSNVPWPPKALQTITPKLDEWSAWYSGEPTELARVYRERQTSVRPSDRPSTYRGGLIGTVARMFWGAPQNAGETLNRLHVPIASDICQASADLLFAEPPQIVGADDATNKHLGLYLEDGLIGALAQGAETGAALGGTYLRVTWDPALQNRSFITVIDADGASPEFLHGRLRAVTFWWVVAENGTTVLRHLERHELDTAGRGLIFHGLYQGTHQNLGQVIPLTEHPSTETLPVDAEGAIDSGPGLAAVYVPNRLPNSVWRTDPLGRNLGQSDLAKSEPLMDNLDRTYTNWMRDLDKAKGRIIVPDYMLEVHGPGKGVSFDVDREVFTGLGAIPNADGRFDLQVVQFDFDPAKYAATAQQLVEDILRRSGYSAQTFGEDETGGAATATEVTSRDRRSALTRDRKLRAWKPATRALVAKMLVVDRDQFGATVDPESVSVEFAEEAQETPLQLATTAEMLKRAGAASTKMLVARVNPDWADDLVDEEVTRILDEAGSGPLADPGAPFQF